MPFLFLAEGSFGSPSIPTCAKKLNTDRVKVIKELWWRHRNIWCVLSVKILSIWWPFFLVEKQTIFILLVLVFFARMKNFTTNLLKEVELSRTKADFTMNGEMLNLPRLESPGNFISKTKALSIGLTQKAYWDEMKLKKWKFSLALLFRGLRGKKVSTFQVFTIISSCWVGGRRWNLSSGLWALRCCMSNIFSSRFFWNKNKNKIVDAHTNNEAVRGWFHICL